MNSFVRLTMWGMLSFYGIACAQTREPLVLTLIPGTMDESSGRGIMDIALAIPKLNVPAGTAVLKLPLVVSNADSVATTLQILAAEDADGALELLSRDDSVGPAAARHWYANRPVRGRLQVRYRVPIDNAPPTRGTSPPYMLRTEGGGFSGVGNTFILLPEQSKPSNRAQEFPISIRWKLEALGPGATATSSYGEGNVDLPPGQAERLTKTVFMAGQMQRLPEPVASTGFSSAWLGKPPSDPAPLMRWGEKLYDWMGIFFQDKATRPYRVFLRYNPINAGGGSALTSSFLVTYGDNVAPGDLKATLSHEMIHTWTAMPDAQWYSEGVAVYYQALLPWRAGLFTSEEFINDVNQTAARYYANAMNATPDSEISGRFWDDTRIRVLPYDRGALYLVVLDARIRAASSGKRSLDNLILAMNQHRQAGTQGANDTETLWKNLLASELGERGLAIHAAMKAGGLMLPESRDFGPCFQRVTKRMRRFELGFEPKSLVGSIKTIRGLIPESAAARAGLRNGDVVTYRVALDIVQAEPTSNFTLYVTRGNKSFTVTYLPRGELVDVWQWERIGVVPESACKQ